MLINIGFTPRFRSCLLWVLGGEGVGVDRVFLDTGVDLFIIKLGLFAGWCLGRGAGYIWWERELSFVNGFVIIMEFFCIFLPFRRDLGRSKACWKTETGGGCLRVGECRSWCIRLALGVAVRRLGGTVRYLRA